MDTEKPPRSPHSSLSHSGSRPSSSGSRKTPRTSSSDSPSNSATNEHGRRVLDRRLRSVLSHRLGLPLLSAFHGNDPSVLPYLSKKSDYFPHGTKGNDHEEVLQTAVNNWSEDGVKKEPQLTKIVSRIINNTDFSFNALEEVDLVEPKKPKGRIDILFTAAETKKDNIESTPLMVVEVGLKGLDWWKKFDQGVKYLERMRTGTQPVTCVRFQKPLLLAIMTIDDEREMQSGYFVVKLGVFLCVRKNADYEKDEFRMSLLWHSKTSSLKDGSAMFGQLLRGASDFSSWREEPDESSGYEYFSSNCCKVDDKVSGCVYYSFQFHAHFLAG